MVGGNYNRIGRSTGGKRMTSCYNANVASAVAAEHEEFERLVHAATFLSRDEYKSTCRRLPRYARDARSARCLNRPRDICTSRRFRDLSVCVCPFVCRYNWVDERDRRHSRGVARETIASSIRGAVHAKRIANRAFDRRPREIRDGRRDYYDYRLGAFHSR